MKKWQYIPKTASFIQFTSARSIAAADSLFVELLDWLPKRKRCAKELEDIADKLDDMRKTVNVAKVIGSTVSTLASVGGLAATFLTGGLAAPFAVAAVAGGAGVATSCIASLIEALESSDQMKKSKKILKNDQRSASEIEDLIGELLKEIAETGFQSDELEQGLEDSDTSDISVHDMVIIYHFLGALARRNNVSLEFDQNEKSLSILRCLYNSDLGLLHSLIDAVEDLNDGSLEIPLCSRGAFSKTAVSNLVKESSKRVVYSIVSDGSKKVTREIVKQGTKTAARSAAKVASVIGLVFNAVDLVDSSLDLAKSKPTEASKQLRDGANKIRSVVKQLTNLLQSLKNLVKDIAAELERWAELERRAEMLRRAELERRAEMLRRAELERRAEVERRAEMLRRAELKRRVEVEMLRRAELERRAEMLRRPELERRAEMLIRPELERQNLCDNPVGVIFILILLLSVVHSVVELIINLVLAVLMLPLNVLYSVVWVITKTVFLLDVALAILWLPVVLLSAVYNIVCYILWFLLDVAMTLLWLPFVLLSTVYNIICYVVVFLTTLVACRFYIYGLAIPAALLGILRKRWMAVFLIILVGDVTLWMSGFYHMLSSQQTKASTSQQNKVSSSQQKSTYSSQQKQESSSQEYTTVARFQKFLNQHHNREKDPNKCNALMALRHITVDGNLCKKLNTFVISDSKNAIKDVCADGGTPTGTGSLRISKNFFQVIICELKSGLKYPCCKYNGHISSRRITIECVNGVPVHLDDTTFLGI